LNSFEGTEIYNILRDKITELDLLSNPDKKVIHHIKHLKQNNEWEDRLKEGDEKQKVMDEAEE